MQDAAAAKAEHKWGYLYDADEVSDEEGPDLYDTIDVGTNKATDEFVLSGR